MRGYLVQYNKHSIYKCQVVYDTKNNATYTRYANQSGWSNWERTDNYGTASLSELASALGVITYNVQAISDCKAFVSPGMYDLVENTQHAPFRYGLILALPGNNISSQIKIAFNASSGHPIGVLYGSSDWAFFDKVN